MRGWTVKSSGLDGKKIDILEFQALKNRIRGEENVFGIMCVSADRKKNEPKGKYLLGAVAHMRSAVTKSDQCLTLLIYL